MLRQQVRNSGLLFSCVSFRWINGWGMGENVGWGRVGEAVPLGTMRQLVQVMVWSVVLGWGFGAGLRGQVAETPHPGRWARRIFVGYHQVLLAKKPVVRRVTSVDLRPKMDIGQAGQRLQLGLQANYGLYGTAVRWTYGIWSEAGFTDRRQSLDWQALVLHPIQTATWSVWIGTGLALDLQRKSVLHEQAGGFRVYLLGGKCSLEGLGRFARRYRDGWTRWEVQGNGMWWFLRDEKMRGALVLGGGWRAWSDREDGLGMAGLHFNFN